MKDLHSLKRILKLGHSWHQRERIEGAHHHLSSHDYCALVDQALSPAELQGHYRHLIVTAEAKTVDALSDQQRSDHCANLRHNQLAVSSPEDAYSAQLTDAISRKGVIF